MVSLPLLARLLDAVRPEARLVLVGDPFQLASIEAGTVMADMVGSDGQRLGGDSGDWPLAGRVTELRRGHRFDEGSATAALGPGHPRGTAMAMVSSRLGADPEIHWVRPDDPTGLDDVRRLVTAAAVEVVRGGAGRRRRARRSPRPRGSRS